METLTEAKTCCLCGQGKPATRDFFPPSKTSGASGLDPRCKKCDAKRQAQRRARKLQLDPEYVRKQNLRRLWGDDTIYDKLVECQGETCAICGDVGSWQRLGIDHDHGTGAVRGLLCSPCNTAIGMMKDDPARLRAAVAYLADPPCVGLGFEARRK